MIEKTIKVFLASSEELSIDRLQFGDFVNHLNNIYRNRGIYIELLKWEGFDASISALRKQSDYNEVVRDSDMFLALFHTKAGEFTLEEFDVALDEFAKSKEKPRIYAYFKELENGQTEEASLAEFKKKLMDEIGHYYCRYGNPDTMMLHFILQIKVLNLDTAPEVKVEDSQVTIDGSKVIDLGKIPFLNKNKDYLKLKDQLAKFEEKYLDALDQSSEHPDDPGYLAEVVKISEAKNTLRKDLENLEKNMVGFAEKLLELSSRSVSSARLRKAQEYFENGDIEGANTVLNYEEISTDIDYTVDSIERNSALIKKTEALIEEGKKQLSVYVDELLMKAETLQLDLSNKNRFAEAEACYSKAADISERYNLDGKVYFIYGNYLRHQNNYQASEYQLLRYFRWAKEKAEKDPGAYMPYLALSQNNLGILYRDTGRMREAEELYTAALATYKALTEKKPGTHLPDLAMIQNNLGLLYNDSGRMREAEELYTAALATYKALTEKKPGAYLPDLVNVQNNLGLLYYNTDRMREAEELYTAALATRKALAEKNPGVYLPYVATSQNNLGSLYSKTGRMREAEELYTAALATRKALAEKNPGAYLPDLAASQNNLGGLYKELGRMREAEELYTAALATRKVLAEREPGAYLPKLAMAQDNLGIIYDATGRMDEGEKMHLAALATYKALAEKEPRTYLPEVAASQNILGIFYGKNNRLKEAEELYTAALTTYKALAEKEPDAYLPKVASIQNSIGVIYHKTRRLKEAEELYTEALATYKALAEKEPRVYLPKLAMTQDNLALIYDAAGRMDEGEKMHLAALSTYKGLAEKEPRVYLKEVAASQINLGRQYNAAGRLKEAEELYTEALTTYKALAEKEPGAYLPYLAMIQNNLGVLYHKTDRLKEAEELFTVALTTRKALADKNPGAYLTAVVDSQINLGELYCDTGRLKEAEEIFQASLDTCAVLHNDYHLSVNDKINEIEKILNEIKTKIRKAEEIRIKANTLSYSQPLDIEDYRGKLYKEYKEQLARWESLPLLNRLVTPKPKKPKDVI